jgi:N-acetylglucosaminyldiphosphoundecaprenol N-acetyl-beta-D-mannosaminyltransferase
LSAKVRFQQILGIPFLVGTADDAIDQISGNGGMVVVPAAPALKNLAHDKRYRDALLGADFAIADSAFMVILWNLIQHDNIPKLSGLRYLRALIDREQFRRPGASFWVMPNPNAARRNLAWLRENGMFVTDDDVYLAPIYPPTIEDCELLSRLDERRPAHVVLGLGGGAQERLGLYLKQNLSYCPAIHCIGAAIAFLSGDQVHIPVWVDHAGLGWLWRSLSAPSVYGPRYWDARHLAPLIIRFRDRLPSLAS